MIYKKSNNYSYEQGNACNRYPLTPLVEKSALPPSRQGIKVRFSFL